MNLKLRELRGLEQSRVFKNYIEMLSYVIHKEWQPFVALGLIVLSPFNFKGYREDEADRIAWVNGLPEHVLRSLSDDDLWFCFRIRHLPHIGRLDHEGMALAEFSRRKLRLWNWRFAVRMERGQRRDEIQCKWSARKIAHATPKAAAKIRTVRL